MKCLRCGADNVEGKKFCGDCGEMLDSAAALLQKVRAAVKDDNELWLRDRFKDEKVVENEITERVVEKITGWGKILAYLLGIPFALLLTGLSIFGISKLSDLPAMVEAARKKAEARMNIEVEAAQGQLKLRMDDNIAKADVEARKHLQDVIEQSSKNLDKIVANAMSDYEKTINDKVGLLEAKVSQGQRTRAGFDTSAYPGDAAMQLWRKTSPYRFVTYYLQAPCHHSASWSGKRQQLVTMGWELAVVYVGRQAAGNTPCGSSDLSREKGVADAVDAVNKAVTEKFAPGVIILDVERVDNLSKGLTDYAAAWALEVRRRGHWPGVYCFTRNANALRSAILNEWGEDGREPLFWVYGGVASTFNIDSSLPTDSGIPFAAMWQAPQSVLRTFSGVTLNVDEDIARTSASFIGIPARVIAKK